MTKADATWDPYESGQRMPRIFSDHAIEIGSETLSFDFDDMAKTLALLALNGENPTPFSVVVRGGWGRGKTTLLKRAQHLMETAGTGDGVREVRTLWFNAWKYPDEDTVLAGLLGALLDSLGQGTHLDQLKKYAASFKGSAIVAVLKAAAPPGLKEIFKVKLEDRYSEVWEKRAFYDTFRQLFNETSRLLFELKAAFRDTGGLDEQQLWSPEKQKKQTLAIFLDDLDRCRPERVAQVLEAINLFLDLPGVCFFLGVDWKRLAQNLPESVRQQGDETQYLQKIFQVILDLPVVTPGDAGTYLSEQIHGTALEWGLDLPKGKERDSYEAKQAFEAECTALATILESRHPRHIKRFLNDLSMILGALATAGRLGKGKEQVTERSVLAWHLLSEYLEEQAWRELRTSEPWARRSLEKLLAERAEGQGPEPGDGDEGAKAGDKEASGEEASQREWQERGQKIRPYLEELRDLEPQQLHLLVHFAAPPVVEAPSAAASVETGRFRLDSGAWVQLEAKKPFIMGSDDSDRENERPAHPVTLSPYWIGKYPVTNEDYSLYAEEVGKKPPRHWSDGEIPEGKERHPVVYVSWEDAIAYCTWLTGKLKEGGFVGEAGLPTEAQWEFAARGQESREYPWEGEEEPSEELANFDSKVGDTTPVGAYPKGATPEGVHDLAGNVWEWCRDRYASSYEKEPSHDPPGPDSGASRVVRGGAFLDGSWALRGAYRNGFDPGSRVSILGFRVVFAFR